MLATGLRLLGRTDPTDAMEAKSLTFRLNHVDVFSCSWGPGDTGWTIDGPGKLMQEALMQGALHVSAH